MSIAKSQERNSEHDKSGTTEVLDNSYIDYAIYSLFYIDVINYIKVKASLAKNFHIQPSELDNMPAWEYSLFLKEINDLVKEENDQHQKEMDKAGYKDIKKMSDPKHASKQANKYMPKGNSTPKMPNMGSMGSFKMPKL